MVIVTCNNFYFSGVAKVVLKKGKTQLFRYGSPMVYSGAVDRIIGRPPPKTGDIVLVADGAEKSIGWGLYNSVSMFCVRLMQLEEEALRYLWLIISCSFLVSLCRGIHPFPLFNAEILHVHSTWRAYWSKELMQPQICEDIWGSLLQIQMHSVLSIVKEIGLLIKLRRHGVFFLEFLCTSQLIVLKGVSCLVETCVTIVHSAVLFLISLLSVMCSPNIVVHIFFIS